MGDDKLVRDVRRRARQKQAQTNEALKQQAQRTIRKDYHELKFVNPVAFNEQAEEEFVELARRLIMEQPGGTIPLWVITDQEAPFELKISSTTARRYMSKHTARRAEFRSFGKLVMLNPNYEAPELEQSQEQDQEEKGE